MKSNSPVINYLYKTAERVGLQVISLFVTIVLARIIDISENGAIELILVLVSLCQVFVQQGLNSALVQKKDANDLDFSAAFYLNLIIAVILYLLLFISAPYIEKFYNIQSLGKYLRVCALILIPSSYNSIQNAFMAKNFMFSTQMHCCLLSGLLSGIIGIVLAKMGFGIWSYIVYQLASSALTPFICKFFVKWKPGKIDSFQRVYPICKFGIRVLGANLLETIYNDISSLAIGKKYTSTDLALYGKGKQFPQAVINILNGSLATVSFPYFTKAQDDISRIKEMSRITIKLSSFIVFPAMFGLAIIAKPLIVFLLTEKWIGSVPFLQLMCVTYVVMPIYATISQTLNAIGRSDIHFKIELSKKLVNSIFLFIAIIYFRSIYAILIGQIVAIPVCVAIGMRECKKRINYHISELLYDVFYPTMISLLMCVVIYFLNSRISLPLMSIVVDVLLGAFVYFFLNIISQNENYKLALTYLRRVFEKQRSL